MSWLLKDYKVRRRHESNAWCNRVRKRRRRKVLAKHHRKVIKAVHAARAKGVRCPPHPKRPKDWL